MASGKKPPKTGPTTPSPPAAQEPPQHQPFGAAEEEAAMLMGWLPVQDALKQDLDAIYKRARDLTRMARSENTRRSYKTAWAQYDAWCQSVGVKALSGDPGTVALYLSVLSKKVRPTTLKARLAAISVAHRLAGLKLDTGHEAIRLIMRGAAREKGLAPLRQAKALHYRSLPILVDQFGDSALDTRNKAILLLGFAGALRRSEIAALTLSNIGLEQEGLQITLARSKGDRLGRSETLYISSHPNKRLCPLTALKSWLAVRGETQGPLFLRANRNDSFRHVGIGDQAVNNILKSAIEKMGFDKSLYSGHRSRHLRC